MDQETLWREYLALPSEARREVDDFIAFLASRYVGEPQAPARPRRALDEEPFVGMWRDRKDLVDSTAWVRAIREREWTQSDG